MNLCEKTLVKAKLLFLICSILILSLSTSCGTKYDYTKTYNPEQVGYEGGPCSEYHTCKGDLVCDMSDLVCVESEENRGYLGKKCLKDLSCREGLLCKNKICVFQPQIDTENTDTDNIDGCNYDTNDCDIIELENIPDV